MFTRLYLCRHGEVAGDGKRRYNGHRDVDISENGVRQMKLLKEKLKDAPLTAIFSSDLIRTVKGAEIIGAYHNAPRIIKVEFKERSVGVWEGMSFEEIEGRYPDDWKAWLSDIVHFAPPGGESLLEVSHRVLPILRRVIETHSGEEILLVAHGGVNRVILSAAMGLDLKQVFHIEQNYGGLNIIDYYDDGISVVKLLNG